MEKRLNRARNHIKGLDAVVFVHNHTIRYLCRFSGTEAIMLLTDADAFLYVDSRYFTQAIEETKGVSVIQVSERWEDVYGHIHDLGIETLGIESNMMDVDTYIKIKDMFSEIEITPIGLQLKDLRAVKDSHEIDIMRKAALISEEALDTVLQNGIVGRTENEIAFELEWGMRKRGASAVSFELIVASGPRSAMPHGVSSGKIIGCDESIVIDFGCIYQGYCSDQTITVYSGKPPQKFVDVYQIVREAQQRAISGISAGKKASDIDTLARDFIEKKGYGAYFGHGLGHGVGMEVHESPVVSARSDDILEEGMVITIEPGIYIPSKFGIRLEDTLLITDNSCQFITNLDKGAIKIIH